jgi:tRNA (guanine-N7-)-methyltransferase
MYHPDPWLKKRHRKRRIVSAEFLAAIAPYLTPDTPLYFQTDVFLLFEAAEEEVALSPHFTRLLPDPSSAPLTVHSEREAYAEKEGSQIFRMHLVRKD